MGVQFLPFLVLNLNEGWFFEGVIRRRAAMDSFNVSAGEFRLKDFSFRSEGFSDDEE